VVELPSLERLSLKYVLVYMRLTCTVHCLGVSNNRLQPLSNLKLGRDAFSHLTELQLNGTLMTWQAIMGVVCLMPRLQRLESGYNRLQHLSFSSQNHPELVITTLNLDSNQLSNWVETCQALVSFHKYSNHLKTVSTSLIRVVCQACPPCPFLQLIRIYIRSNRASCPVEIDPLVPFLDPYLRVVVGRFVEPLVP
jgi:hypothetical protein